MASNGNEPFDSKKTKRRRRVNGFEEWGGYMPAKKAKLEAQFRDKKPIELRDELTTNIFEGISIFVNGYTKPPAEELKRLMNLHGGIYHYYYSHAKTTHIIASNLPNTKIKNLKKEIVVTADWITDSIKAGKLLPTHEYLLYSPEVKDKQQKLVFQKSLIDKKKEPVSLDLHFNTLVDASFNGDCEEKRESFKNSSDESVSSPPCFDSVDSPTTNQEEKDSKTSNLPEKVSELPPATKTSVDKFNSVLHKNEPAITAVHPDFLSEFYSHSRLHHISTGGQELKRYVQYLIDNKKDFIGRDKLKKFARESCPSFGENLLLPKLGNSKFEKKSSSVIMHLDMDCFFVSVGLRKHPELKGVPVAVTHSKGGKRGGPQEGSDIHYEASHYANQSEKKVQGLTAIDMEDDFQGVKPKISIHSKEYGSLSEIASCSYEARKAGLRNGMFLGEALRRCPNLKTIPYDFDSYTEVSKQLYDIVSSYTLEIEAVSVDELYIDCSELLRGTQVSPLQFAFILRNEIFEKTKCSASAGLGSNMLIARLATKMAKPNGQYLVEDLEVEEFMKKQKVENLPGVGYRMSKKLEQLGVVTCSDLQNMSLNELQKEFGPKTGDSVYKKCRGRDDRKVQASKERKSVSAEINYGIRFETNEDATRFINDLASEVQNRLQNINCKGKAITLKLMVRKLDAPVETAKFMGHGVCDSMSKSVVLKSATDSSKVIANECCALAKALKINPKDYRGVGIQVSKLEQNQKKESIHKILKNFFNLEGTTSKPIQTKLTSPNKAIKISPQKNSIKNLLTKPCKKVTYDLADYIPEQLDQSVLNALPEELKKEILENCAKPHKSHETVKSNKLLESLPSPVKPKKDLKLNSIADRSNSVLKYVNCEPSTSAIPGDISKKRSFPNDIISLSKADVSCKRRKKRVIEFFVTWGDKEKKFTHESSKVANLGGAVELDDVRKLLREWILNTNDPIDEDIEEFKQFLLDSIDHDLSKVSLLLKCFHRLACSHGPLWQEAYLSILSYVQQKMLQNYGAMLSANSDFPT